MQPTPRAGVASSTPDPVTIQSRQDRFQFNDVPQIWLKTRCLTHFFNALSVLIPQSERLVISILREDLHNTDDPRLRKEIAAAIKQEARHTRIHLEANQRLADCGYPALPMFSRWQERVLQICRRLLPTASIPAAFEHFTSRIARAILQDETHWSGGKTNQAVDFMRWHAVEEVEHQAVCYDLHRDHQLPGWLLTLFLLILWMPMTLFSVYGIQTYLLIRDRAWRHPRFWSDWFASVRMTLPLLSGGAFQYLAGNFTPWQRGDEKLYRARLAELTANQQDC